MLNQLNEFQAYVNNLPLAPLVWFSIMVFAFTLITESYILMKHFMKKRGKKDKLNMTTSKGDKNEAAE